MADRLDEQLHATCSGIFSHCVSPSALARGLSLVPGKNLADTKMFSYVGNLAHQPGV